MLKSWYFQMTVFLYFNPIVPQPSFNKHKAPFYKFWLMFELILCSLGLEGMSEKESLSVSLLLSFPQPLSHTRRKRKGIPAKVPEAANSLCK